MSDLDDIRGSDSRKLTPFSRRKLQRAIAAGEKKRAQIARDFGVSTSYVSQFAKTYAFEIDQLKQALDDQFAGLWIADKAARIAAYQADLEASAADTKHAGYFEQIRTRTAILRAVAEELGQLPPRATLTIMPVVHVLEGVSPEVLK